MAVGALVLLALAACQDEEAGFRQPSPTVRATLPPAAATPSEGTAACAADSTQRFLDAQQAAPFEVYCPTFLPEGFALEDIQFGDVAGAVAPPEGPGALQATFRRDDPEGRIEIIEGRPGISQVAEMRASGQELLGETAYDGFQASLLEQAVVGRSPDGFTHLISVERLTTEELQQIAAGMSPLSP